jgi:poly-gamma-glutamate synthesis protein (capsule biosynthesis protein)
MKWHRSHAHLAIGAATGFLFVFLSTGIFIVGKNEKIDEAEISSRRNIPAVIQRPSSTLIVVGDIMLGRFVETLMNRNGTQYPFEKISSTLTGVDAAVGNFEGVIDRDHKQTVSSSFAFSFPPAVAGVLVQNHFSFLTLGNNHAYDFGRRGYLDTVAALKERSIAVAGDPYAIGDESWYEGMIGGMPITLVSLNATFPHFATTTALMLVQDLKKKYPEALLMVFMHWGVEYELAQNKEQQDLAHDLIDSRADIVIGSHPHVVQGIESYKNRLIFYSLGNFIFDQYFSRAVQQELMLKLDVSDSGVTAALIPLQSAQSQPASMAPEAAQKRLDELAARSNPSLGSAIRTGILSAPR